MKHESALRRAPTTTTPPAPGNFAGKWTNELGSTMELTVSGTRVSGSYRSQVSGKDQPVEGPLTGEINGDQIAFCVNWTTMASLTSWVGQVVAEDGGEELRTMWLLTRNVPDDDEAADDWQATLVGSDTFVRST